jgi:hypothetical protein
VESCTSLTDAVLFVAYQHKLQGDALLPLSLVQELGESICGSQ